MTNEANLEKARQMKKQHLINYFSQQVDLYLDNRLTEESKECLMQIVNQDKECCQIFIKEKNFRDFVKSHVKRPDVPTSLIEDIRSKIL